MPDKLIREFPGDPNDIRFQFEVIKQLAESVRQQAEVLRDVQRDMREGNKTQVDVLQRLTKIEANRVNETVAELKGNLDAACLRIDRLEQDKDRRDGALSAWSWLARNWPFTVLMGALGVFIAWANGKLGR